jgi:2-C-methyl-D-erythritol 2,4-cyclodiphosphate synthase
MTGLRIGIGFDAHPFREGVPLRLGGLGLPHDRGLEGHSDGDALLHAVADAILGAAGQPSLGELFSDQDSAWAGADSALFLEEARALAEAQSLRIANVDAVVIAESPRIAPHRESVRRRIAELLHVSVSCVNVRGTSTNAMGFPGRGEGIAVMAVVLLEPVAGSR